MSAARRRPFYAEYAWAFNLLIERPIKKEGGVIAAWLVERDVLPGSTLLDAGCGSGGYAIELARRGYVVHGVDLSPELVEIAKRSAPDPSGAVSFDVGDILDLPDRRYDGVLCRGVLNDVLEDSQRTAVFAAFARTLRPRGVLVLDVREWETSAARKTREPLFRKRVPTDRGELTFTSVTTLDPEHRRLMVAEQHALVHDGQERISEYQFVMGCWTREEMDGLLAQHGFTGVRVFGAYDPTVPVGVTDRLVVVASWAGS